MLKRAVLRAIQCLIAATISCWVLPAQMTVTGTITGNVVDPTGQAVANAKITLTSVSTSEVRTATANELGVFTLAAVQPDTYNLRIEQKGFKAYSRNRLVVSANERVAIGDVMLQVGDVTETISVIGGSGAGADEQLRTLGGTDHDSADQPDGEGPRSGLDAAHDSGRAVSGRSGFHGRQLRHRHAEHRGHFFRHQHSGGGRRGQQRPGNAERVLQRDHAGRDRRSQGAGEQLPGGIRRQRRTDRAGGDARRRQGDPRQRLRVHPQRRAERQRFLQQPQQRAAAALSLQHVWRIAGRADLHTGALEPGQDQDVRAFTTWSRR